MKYDKLFINKCYLDNEILDISSTDRRCNVIGTSTMFESHGYSRTKLHEL